MSNNKLTIVCISPAPWDYPVWTNRQHIMSRIAKDHTVVYVFHPALSRSAVKRNVCRNNMLLGMTHRVHDHLYLYTPFILPMANRFPLIHRLNIKFSSWFLKRLLKGLALHTYIAWFYDAEAVGYLDELNPVLSCYDCVDDYASMPAYADSRSKQRLVSLETELIKRSDLVFTTSTELLRKKSVLNSNTVLVENVGDFEHFNRAAQKQPEPLAGLPLRAGPLIGFVGAMDDYKVDYDLIRYIAEQRPDWTLMLIGSTMGSTAHTSGTVAPNIMFLGKKAYSELPAYMAHFDVCIIPYKINDYTRHVFPLKLFEYMATGKPIVSTELPSLEEYRPIIRIADTYDCFIKHIGECLQNDTTETQAQRLAVARQNTWETRKDKLLGHIRNALP